MQQRVIIAAALILHPALVIADEPTTALDVTVQMQILALLKRLQEGEANTSIILISHDLGVVAQMCERVCVMYAGTIVEAGTTEEVLENPRHPYTVGLIELDPAPRRGEPDAQPDPGRRGGPDPPAPRLQVQSALRPRARPLPHGTAGPAHGGRRPCRSLSPLCGGRPVTVLSAPETAPLLEVDGLTKHFPVRRDMTDALIGKRRVVHAVDGLTFTIGREETFGLVGESGSGKSTTGKVIARLIPASAGQVRLDGEDWLAFSGDALRRRRRDVQMIFQNPYASLDPRWSVFHIVARAARHPIAWCQGGSSDSGWAELLDAVGLDPSHAQRYPHPVQRWAAPAYRPRPGAARARPQAAGRRRAGVPRSTSRSRPRSSTCCRRSSAATRSASCSFPTISPSSASSATGWA